MIDDSYDSDFPAPHLDPPQQNDDPRWVGVDQAVIDRFIEPSNRRDWMFGDEADYIKSDEDQESNDAEL